MSNVNTLSQSQVNCQQSSQSDFLDILDTLPAPLLARAFPVNGKVPIVKGWQRANPKARTIAGYRARFANAHGCGLRTGLGPGRNVSGCGC